MIETNIQNIRESVRRCCLRSGRDVSTIKLIAVSKTHTVESIREAYQAGQRCFGESRVQEALQKILVLPSDIEWHFIGPLQSNKVKSVIQSFALIHSVDSLDLARTIDRRAGQIRKKQDIMLEINIGRESSKHGFDLNELTDTLKAMRVFSNLHVRGFMTIPPFHDEAEASRVFFRALRVESQSAWTALGFDLTNLDLSMGMSHDFEVAIEEGATMVRIGTSIFGSRI